MPPTLPPFLTKRHFPGEGGGGVYFEAARGRNFIRPPPPLHPPPLRAQRLKIFKILKFSSEIEIFKRATHQPLFFVGNSEDRD